MNEKDLQYMRLAYNEAIKAYKKGEVPVGCIIVFDDKVIAKSHNLRETKKMVTRHAEINAIEKACKVQNAKFLDGATMYVTLEPCLMCAGAIIQARIKKLIYATEEPKFGCAKSICNIFNDYHTNHTVEIEGGIMKEENTLLMKQFFQELRRKKQ